MADSEAAKATPSKPTTDDASRADQNDPPARSRLTPATASNPTFSPLPQLVTSIGARRTSAARVPSWASRRVSTFSNSSMVKPSSRPQSTAFPAFHTTLQYALVRDFAYATEDPMHYGPPPDSASAPSSTTGSEFPRRLSDPQLIIPFSSGRTPWSGHPDNSEASKYNGPQLPAMAFGDGPPWREDEDLLSPIVTTAKHRKTRSDLDYFSSRSRDVSANSGSGRRTSYAGANQDGSQMFYIDHKEEQEAGGPGGEIVTLPGDSHLVHLGPGQAMARHYDDSEQDSPEYLDATDHRYSRDYSFTIASPDEEMHGKAIALFDFESENDNELPLIEGQVLWVSYRHGEGWLVAKDPATGEDGLVPEAYVRLEREIQGGFGQLNVQVVQEHESPDAPETPTVTSMSQHHFRGSEGGSSQQYPVVSHFTTSSRDLLPQHARSPTAANPSIGSMETQLAQMKIQSAGEGSDGSDSSPGTDADVTERIERAPPTTVR